MTHDSSHDDDIMCNKEKQMSDDNTNHNDDNMRMTNYSDYGGSYIDQGGNRVYNSYGNLIDRDEQVIIENNYRQRNMDNSRKKRKNSMNNAYFLKVINVSIRTQGKDHVHMDTRKVNNNKTKFVFQPHTPVS